MRSQIYLVLIRDGRLALAVGAALEDRLLRDGHGAMALVPAVRGAEFADSDACRLVAPSRSGSESADRGPQVVALYEDGLLASLASLGLPAYVGVRDGEEPRIARWASGSGAIMLPVGTARDLVDAIADHTPWSRYAAGLPVVEYPAAGAEAAPVVPGARRPGHGRPLAGPRRVVTVASVAAGPLLLAGLSPAAMAAGGVSQMPAVAAPASGATVSVLAADTQQAPSAAVLAPAALALPANTAPPNIWGNFFTNPGTGIQDYVNATVTGAGNFLLGPAGYAFSNAFSNYVTQSAQGSSAFWNTLAQGGNAAAVRAGAFWGLWAGPHGVAAGGPICAAPGAVTAYETGPCRFAAGSANHHLAPSPTTSPAGDSAQQAGTTTGNASSGSTIGGFPGRIATAAASGAQPGQTQAKTGAGSGLAAAPSNSQLSPPAPSRPSQSGSAKVNPPVQTRAVARGGGGGGGGIPRNFATEALPTSPPIRATPITSLAPGTPVTTLPKIPRQSGQADQGSLPLGDYYPDGSDDSPDGPDNPVQLASAGSGNSPADGTGDSPTDDTGGSQDGAVVVADNSGGSLGGDTAVPGGAPVGGVPVGGVPVGGVPVGGVPVDGGSLGGNTAVAAAVPPPTATPIVPITDDTPPASLGGNTSVLVASADSLDGAPGDGSLGSGLEGGAVDDGGGPIDGGSATG